MPTCEAHRRRERRWHANRYALELRSLIAQSSVPVSASSDEVDRDRVRFLPYGPLVSDWLAFLAGRLTAEFLRDMARGPRP
jgi:hypothetical protein